MPVLTTEEEKEEEEEEQVVEKVDAVDVEQGLIADNSAEPRGRSEYYNNNNNNNIYYPGKKFGDTLKIS